MSTYHTARRNFLRLAGASIAGAGLHSRAVQAQTTPVGGSSSEPSMRRLRPEAAQCVFRLGTICAIPFG
jgi:hypothetical protein